MAVRVRSLLLPGSHPCAPEQAPSVRAELTHDVLELLPERGRDGHPCPLAVAAGLAPLRARTGAVSARRQSLQGLNGCAPATMTVTLATPCLARAGPVNLIGPRMRRTPLLGASCGVAADHQLKHLLGAAGLPLAVRLPETCKLLGGSDCFHWWRPRICSQNLYRRPSSRQCNLERSPLRGRQRLLVCPVRTRHPAAQLPKVPPHLARQGLLVRLVQALQPRLHRARRLVHLLDVLLRAQLTGAPIRAVTPAAATHPSRSQGYPESPAARAGAARQAYHGAHASDDPSGQARE